LSRDLYFRKKKKKKKKKKKSVIIIIVIETKSKEHIYKKELVNPLNMIFQEKKFGTTMHRFNPAWFKEYKLLEYNIEKDAAYCLYYSNQTLKIKQGKFIYY
jgi:hypothetical protein